MPFEDFKGFWRVDSATDAECAVNSVVTFVQTGGEGTEKVTILCVKSPFPYGEGTARYNRDTNMIEFSFNEQDYVISFREDNPSKIELRLKGQVPGQVTGSWTAEDYVPGSASEPAGE